MESPPSTVATITTILEQQPQHRIAVSELVRMECLVGCRRAGNTEMEADYEAYLANQTVHFLSINIDVWNRAIALRSQHAGLRIPDALHLSIAIEHQCQSFWSFDQRLLSVAEKYISVFKKS